MTPGQKRSCQRHRRYTSEAAAWRHARYLSRVMTTELIARPCGNHWHVGHLRGSIWTAFDAIEQERRQRGKAS